MAANRASVASPAPGFAWRRRSAPWVTPALLLLPTAASLLAISVYPILNGLWLSLRDTSLIAPEDRFVGLQNYFALLGDGQFWNAWKHTIQFTAASTLLETVLGLVMALVLHETFAGRGMVRAAMLVPWAIPTVVTSKMFGWLFDGQNGLVNHALQGLRLISENVGWYSSPDYALLTIIIADVWKTTAAAAADAPDRSAAARARCLPHLRPSLCADRRRARGLSVPGAASAARSGSTGRTDPPGSTPGCRGGSGSAGPAPRRRRRSRFSAPRRCWR